MQSMETIKTMHTEQQHDEYLWDPRRVLKLNRCDKNCCVALDESAGRQCSAKRNDGPGAERLLKELQRFDPQSTIARESLLLLAPRVLCWQHWESVGDVYLMAWARRLLRAEAPKRVRSSRPALSRLETEPTGIKSKKQHHSVEIPDVCLWNAYAALSELPPRSRFVKNKMEGKVTCIGKKRNGPCSHTISQPSCTKAQSIAEELSSLRPRSSTAKELLPALADSLLCQAHNSQREELVQRWSNIMDHVRPKNRPHFRQSAPMGPWSPWSNPPTSWLEATTSARSSAASHHSKKGMRASRPKSHSKVTFESAKKKPKDTEVSVAEVGESTKSKRPTPWKTSYLASASEFEEDDEEFARIDYEQVPPLPHSAPAQGHYFELDSKEISPLATKPELRKAHSLPLNSIEPLETKDRSPRVFSMLVDSSHSRYSCPPTQPPRVEEVPATRRFSEGLRIVPTKLALSGPNTGTTLNATETLLPFYTQRTPNSEIMYSPQTPWTGKLSQLCEPLPTLAELKSSRGLSLLHDSVAAVDRHLKVLEKDPEARPTSTVASSTPHRSTHRRSSLTLIGSDRKSVGPLSPRRSSWCSPLHQTRRSWRASRLQVEPLRSAKGLAVLDVRTEAANEPLPSALDDLNVEASNVPLPSPTTSEDASLVCSPRITNVAFDPLPIASPMPSPTKESPEPSSGDSGASTDPSSQATTVTSPSSFVIEVPLLVDQQPEKESKINIIRSASQPSHPLATFSALTEVYQAKKAASEVSVNTAQAARRSDLRSRYSTRQSLHPSDVPSTPGNKHIDSLISQTSPLSAVESPSSAVSEVASPNIASVAIFHSLKSRHVIRKPMVHVSPKLTQKPSSPEQRTSPKPTLNRMQTIAAEQFGAALQISTDRPGLDRSRTLPTHRAPAPISPLTPDSVPPPVPPKDSPKPKKKKRRSRPRATPGERTSYHARVPSSLRYSEQPDVHPALRSGVSRNASHDSGNQARTATPTPHDAMPQGRPMQRKESQATSVRSKTIRSPQLSRTVTPELATARSAPLQVDRSGSSATPRTASTSEVPRNFSRRQPPRRKPLPGQSPLGSQLGSARSARHHRVESLRPSSIVRSTTSPNSPPSRRNSIRSPPAIRRSMTSPASDAAAARALVDDKTARVLFEEVEEQEHPAFASEGCVPIAPASGGPARLQICPSPELPPTAADRIERVEVYTRPGISPLTGTRRPKPRQRSARPPSLIQPDFPPKRKMSRKASLVDSLLMMRSMVRLGFLSCMPGHSDEVPLSA